MNFEKKAKVLFNYILREYKMCDNYISKLAAKKNNLKNLQRQSQDDSQFYESILGDTIFFFTQSIEIRRIKLAKDLTVLNKFFNPNCIDYKIITKSVLNELLEKYRKAKSLENTSELIWIKDDDITFVGKWKKDLMNTFNYHYCIVHSFRQTLQNEFYFYNDNRPMDQLVESLINKRLKREAELEEQRQKEEIATEVEKEVVEEMLEEENDEKEIKVAVEEEMAKNNVDQFSVNTEEIQTI